MFNRQLTVNGNHGTHETAISSAFFRSRRLMFGRKTKEIFVAFGKIRCRREPHGISHLRHREVGMLQHLFGFLQAYLPYQVHWRYPYFWFHFAEQLRPTDAQLARLCCAIHRQSRYLHLFSFLQALQTEMLYFLRPVKILLISIQSISYLPI